MVTVLSIAGSDSGGGAGIQADIKTLTMNGVFATCAITALTAQNASGVFDVSEVAPQFLQEQIDAVTQDLPPGAVKVGMVSSKELIQTIAERLRGFGAKNVVIDPVMVASSGKRLLKEDALCAFSQELLPLADLLTPNLPEAEILAECEICSDEDTERAAEVLVKRYGCAVLIKGGHRSGGADDFLFADGKGTWLRGERLGREDVHGTGCTLSAAIAANLAKGYPLYDSVLRAKRYLFGAIANSFSSRGGKLLNHCFDFKGEYASVNTI